MSPPPCGTNAAYQAHLRRSEEPCEPCRQAHADYMVERRRTDSAARRREKALEFARIRAARRLAKIYPTAYAALYAEECETVAPLPRKPRGGAR